MTMPARLTLEEFLKLPETEPASEYIDGEVVQKTMPTKGHSIIQRLLSFVLTLYLRAHPIGEAGPELRCIFDLPRSRRSYVPDYAFVASERTQGWGLNDPFRGAPDLAIEILSPDDRMPRVMRKLRFYLENGVRLVWVIDPTRRTVQVMTTPGVSRILTEDDTLDGGDVLPGFTVPVRDILPPA